MPFPYHIVIHPVIVPPKPPHPASLPPNSVQVRLFTHPLCISSKDVLLVSFSLPLPVKVEAYPVVVTRSSGSMKRQLAPSSYYCPISMELMLDPVMLATGHTYERMCIERWLQQGNRTCPVTGMRLRHLELTPNFALRVAVQVPSCPIQPRPVLHYLVHRVLNTSAIWAFAHSR